jgi:hypothetical protein
MSQYQIADRHDSRDRLNSSSRRGHFPLSPGEPDLDLSQEAVDEVIERRQPPLRASSICPTEKSSRKIPRQGARLPSAGTINSRVWCPGSSFVRLSSCGRGTAATT